MENEIELAEGCRTGNEAARKALYTRYGNKMLAVCYRYTGDLDVAHDVLHDGFLKVFSSFTFRGECALGTWLTRIMVTTAIDYLRREQRLAQLVTNEAHLPSDMQLSDLDESTAATHADDCSVSVPVATPSREELMQMVAQLPDGCRTVFNLYVFEEKSHREIAALLGIKEHSSTSQLHRAKTLLAKKIKEYNTYERKR